MVDDYIPMTQSMIETPTDPVLTKMDDGVEKTPVPIILLRMRNTALVTPSFRESEN